MNHEEYIVSLDIGTTQVRAIVAEVDPDGVQIVGVGTAEAKGMKKGAIINIEEAVQSICSAVEHAEQMVGIEISEVFVGISGNHISLQQSHGVVAVSDEDREISSHDIERVMQAAKVIALPPDRVIIEVVPKQFIVDGLDGIRDPYGMIGVRLEAEVLIITGKETIIHNIMRCVEKASLHMVGLIFQPLAVSDLCLTTDEKNLGAIVADIGGATISLAVYQHGFLAGTALIPIGGEYITHDIAYGLRVQNQMAEKIKCKYGVASLKHARAEPPFLVSTIGDGERKCTSLDLAQIMEPRIMEIFQLIRQQIRSMGFSDQPAGGYVLTGGVLATPHIHYVARQELGYAVRIVDPEAMGVKDFSYMNGASVIYYLEKQGLIELGDKSKPSSHRAKKKQRGPSPLERVKIWLSEFI